MNARRVTCLLAVLLLPWPSVAYELATDRSGRPLKWPEPEAIRFVIHLPENPSPALPPDHRLVEAVEEAVRSWNGIDGAAIRIQVEVAPPGTPRPRAGFERGGENVNAILFETDGWRHEPGAFAVTLRTYGSQSGDLLHADIVFNAVQYRWDVLEGRTARDTEGLGPVDVQGVATHELGHALGFEHTQTRPSAMRATVGYGEVWMRDLSETDAEGARFLYPEGDVVARDRAEAEAILTEAAALAGCSAAASTPGPSAAWPVGLLVSLSAALGLAAISRRRSAPSR